MRARATTLSSQVLVAAWLCMACGGHSESAANKPTGDTSLAGAAGSNDSDGAAAATGGVAGRVNLSNGGSGARFDPPGGSAGLVSDAGVPGYVPYIESGTRRCDNADYCFGLSCFAPPSFEPTVCVERCQSDDECAPFEACVQSARLEPTCYARCDSPSACAYHFDCVDFSGAGPLVCLPAAWAARLDDLAD